MTFGDAMSQASDAPVLRAFVISPIGEEGSPLRVHADWVLNEIIRPACKRVSTDDTPIFVERSDHSSLPGAIMTQVVTSIVKDEIIFAVLAGDRPNVYYELAIAIAAGRPVIILKHAGENTHFDVKDFRSITYDYRKQRKNKPAPEAKIAEAANFVRSVLEMPSRHEPKAFGELDPLGQNYREYKFHEKFRDIDLPTYSRFFHNAKSFIGLQGMTLRHFTLPRPEWTTPDGKGHSNFFDLVRGKILLEAVSVHIVLMHPDNAALANMCKFADRAGYAKSVKDARDEAAASFRDWTSLQQELAEDKSQWKDHRKGELQITALRYGVVHYRMMLTDQSVVISPYFNIFPYNSAGPAIGCSRGTVFYDRVNREFFDRIVAEQRAILAVSEHGNLSLGSKKKKG
jgi:hypothetical protein